MNITLYEFVEPRVAHCYRVRSGIAVHLESATAGATVCGTKIKGLLELGGLDTHEGLRPCGLCLAKASAPGVLPIGATLPGIFGGGS